MATEWVVNQEPSSKRLNIQEFTKIDGNTTSYSINAIKANAQIRVEQEADLVLIFLKMGCYSGDSTDKLVASSTTNLLYQSS